MAGELAALGSLGAVCTSTGGFAPLSVTGPLQGGTAVVDGTTSQYLTALLMALVMAENDSVLTLDFLNEADYVRITLDWLKRCGIQVTHRDDLLRFEIPGKQHYQPFSRVIPADFSRVQRQLEAISEHCDEILCYQYLGLMNAPGTTAFCGHPNSTRLFCDYRTSLQNR